MKRELRQAAVVMTRQPRGFSLLEVMVGLAILAVGLVSIIGINAGTLRSHAYAKHLTVATMLARSKMADIESHFLQEGFTSSFDQTMEGDFSEEGWRTFRWKAEIVVPDLDAANTTALVSTLMEQMVGTASDGLDSSDGPQMDPGSMLATIQPMLEGQVTTMVETMKESLREVRLVVSWQDGAKEESFDVVTHLLLLGGQAEGQGGNPPDGVPPGGVPPGGIPPGGALPGGRSP